MSAGVPALALDVQALTYTYPEATAPALRDLTLTIARGDFVVLAGLSACGKSTLLRAAAGLVPHFHGGTFAGTVRTGGLDTREHHPAALAAVCGSLFQDPETQAVLGSVRAELAFPLENRGHGRVAVARGVEEVALALGIHTLLDRPTHELSGGELQRVALGAALAGRPALVLLDEPTSQLDPVAGDELVWLLRRLNEEWGTTVILAEHRLERCLAAADRVIVLQDGAVTCDAGPSAFLEWAGAHAPELQTPGARLLDTARLRPLPAGVKQARAILRAEGLLPEEAMVAGDLPHPEQSPRRGVRARRAARRAAPPPVLELCDVWHELAEGRAILRAVDLAVAPGERVALLGRNGAGKSTLLRHAAGLLAPTRGVVRASGRVALLLQHPGDYLLHETVADEAPASARERAGLDVDPVRHPRDLSGGQRQRLALAVVLGDVEESDGGPPAVIALDEPTRGLDRGAKGDLAARVTALAAAGSAVLVATHDVEFAAAFADRVVLMADGRPIADGAPAEVLTGGWYFSTETARILGPGAGALTPQEGAAQLHRRIAARAPSATAAPPLEVTR